MKYLIIPFLLISLNVSSQIQLNPQPRTPLVGQPTRVIWDSHLRAKFSWWMPFTNSTTPSIVSIDSVGSNTQITSDGYFNVSKGLGTGFFKYPNLDQVNALIGSASSPANLSLGTATATSQDIDNSNGTGVTLPVAVPGSTAGLISASDQTKLNAITGTNSGDQSLSLGTITSTAVPLNISAGSGVSIPLATGSLAGLMSASTQSIGGAKDFTTSIRTVRVGLNIAPSSSVNFYNASDITGSTTAYSHYIVPTILSGVTTAAHGTRTSISTTAASFTLPNLYYNSVFQGTIGAGSAITNQFAYFVASTFTGATNNYAYYSDMASGTNRWNIHMAGSAANYLNGTTLIGSATDNAGGAKLQVTGKISASSAPVNPADVVRKTELDLKSDIANPAFTTNITTPKVTITTPSVASTREAALTSTISDASGSRFDIYNSTSTDSFYAPGFSGYNIGTPTLSSIYFNSQTNSANDSGIVPLMTFTSKLVTSGDPISGTFSDVVNRQLFAWRNNVTTYMQMDASGNLGVTNNITAGQLRVSALNTAPASATATGTLGEVRITATYIYVCTATNTWVRSALSTW